MSEKRSGFMCATGFRALLTVGAVSVFGLSRLHAGNGSSKPNDPMQKIAAIQYNVVKGVPQLRTDFTDNRKFADLLLKAYEENAKFKMALPKVTDWRPAVKAYHAAFEELKKRLQGEWGRIFGNGPSRFPWNGHSDGATDLWREDDLRRDIPVVLSFWGSCALDWGHICQRTVWYDCGYDRGFRIPNDNRAYIPTDAPACLDQKVISKGKATYKKYVSKFFNATWLGTCGGYLSRYFCRYVAELLINVAEALEKQAVCKEDLLLLLNLYADYYSMDAVAGASSWSDGSHFTAPQVARRMVRLMVTCYSNYEKWKPEDQKWLCSLLDNLDANYYLKENLHTYCIQSHDLLRGYFHFVIESHMSVGTNGTRGWISTEKIHDEGLWSVFKKLGNVPLPKATWKRFVNYAERRLALFRETWSWGRVSSGKDVFGKETFGPTDANTILHRSKTFEQIPCADPEEAEWVPVFRKKDVKK